MNHPDPEQPEPKPALDQALSLFMAGRDLPCPHCRYNLRGLTTTLCPECGRAVTPELLRRAASRRRRRPLLIAFALLLVLNGIGAWYQWSSTSRSRLAWTRAGQSFRSSVPKLEARHNEAQGEHAAALLISSKVDGEATINRTNSASNELVDLELKQRMLQYMVDSTGGVSWFTITWWKDSMFHRPHALFLLGAAVSAVALPILQFWPRAARAPHLWIGLAAILTVNGILGLVLLFR